MKKEPLPSPNPVRYATIAVIITGAITTYLGVRDSLIFEGLRPELIVGVILVVAGAAVLITSYRSNTRDNVTSP